MSLLMDALKKAEANRRQSEAPKGGPSLAELALEPVPPAPPVTSPLPELAPKLDALNAELAAGTKSPAAERRPATPAPPPAAARQPAVEREAARQEAARLLFAAKQPAKTRQPLVLFGGAALAAALAIGAYFWWQLQASQRSSLGAAPANAPANAPATIPATIPANAPATIPAPALATASARLPPLPPAAAEPTAAANPDARAATAALPPPTGTSAQAAPAAARSRATPARSANAAAGDAGAEPPLRLVSSGVKVTPLARAYQALQEGRLDESRRDYELVLKGDSRNVDALLGLALIAGRQGRLGDAEAFYLRALDANPADADAQAGLINLRGQSDPQQSESRLKTLLAGQPESASLNFALGNLMARQGRWSDAQQAYFRAWAAASDNADIVYNLAVSLDHLRQTRLALQHYRLALESAALRPAAFDRAATERRIDELQSMDRGERGLR